MLLVKDISLNRSKREIFKNVSMTLTSGKVVILKGKNGSGKTSFLKTILNLINPTAGSVYWKGKTLDKNLYDFYNNITYIADKTTSIKQLTVDQNINIWKKLFLSNIDLDQIQKILFTLNLSIYENTKVSSLSLGEIKKLELIRLVIENKKFWILDEPLTNLDNDSIDVVEQTFMDHRNNGGSIIFSSHHNNQIGASEEIKL